ncbi:MAG: hypothetical protein WC887_01530 [Candidatus Paceibacterota bacterium]|jgi:hypothetical protein
MRKFLAIIMLVVIAAIAGLGCANNPTGPSTETNGSIIVLKNDALSDGTNASPTGYPGNTQMQIGSFVLMADQDKVISQITLSDYDAISTLGDSFQNLSLGSGSLILSSIKNKLNVSTGKYVFVLTPAIRLIPGEKFIVNVYVDILPNAVQSGNIHGVRFYSVTTIDGTGQVGEYSRPFELQSIYIVPQQKG